ncbi:rRNA N6-adenosine-methyltransferase ZCCHC4 isoform X1 [Neodiprion pinetum]|uniref:rRNA N6-adenosine-methyltransferase ZCCHC4 isoform X1 n=2 Tax=Neodiprion pinetum TaxID=441929 RepID=UPI001EDF1670|nr:rRNA N6-adenosine-methyltransferase ZCCHC4 isoform X1 [Neodiprion pinetum]XP_046469142.1 rRNA N6-adenosine-methyltransferase ZCCHC4 isoform X1 [Neodiprion pinetum]
MKITHNDSPSGYQCIWSDLADHPKCPHGPTLLFGRYVDGEYKQFYACSACRDRKLCSFYLEHGSKPTKHQKQAWELEAKKVLPRYDHQKMFILLNEILATNPIRRIYCHDCGRLSFVSEKHKHRGHDIIENLTDHQLRHPTEFLRPLENPKKEAQYLFSDQSVSDIIFMLLNLGAKHILCIGTPRIHEYLVNHHDDKVSSLLLDFDGRYHNFYGPLSFCWYNLFNHHFFHEESKDVLKDFLRQDGGRDTYIICDPPFGGRVEPISQTLKTIYDLHRKWNKIDADSVALKTMFIFPYFMEAVLREKSNPPGILGGLRDLKMFDYKVDYQNHPLFVKSPEKILATPVRIFTDIDLSLLTLQSHRGYKHCKKCNKWTFEENKHCKKCAACTSRDGRRYRHCNICARCVKPTWKHCKKCNRCTLETHKCGVVPKITGKCFRCNEFGHVEKTCTKDAGNISNSKVKSNDTTLKGKKRKHRLDVSDISNKKKARIANASETSMKSPEEFELVSTLGEVSRVADSEKVIPKKLTKNDSKMKNKHSKSKPLDKVSKRGKAIDTASLEKIETENMEDIIKVKKKKLLKLTNSTSKMTEEITTKSKVFISTKSQGMNLDLDVLKQKKIFENKKSRINRKNKTFTNGEIFQKSQSKQK